MSPGGGGWVEPLPVIMQKYADRQCYFVVSNGETETRRYLLMETLSVFFVCCVTGRVCDMCSTLPVVSCY